MEFIIDFQGAKNENDEITIKELAILSTDGRIYELQLSTLPFHEKVKIMWTEKHQNGYYWCTGFKEYSQIKDIFKYIDMKGNVYVKGYEKQTIIKSLLSDLNVNVINLEDYSCPTFSTLKNRTQLSQMKICNLNHSPLNCAYANVQMLLQWWHLEKEFISNQLEKINEAIREWSLGGHMMKPELFKYLPKEFILNYMVFLDCVYHKLPPHLRSDRDILNNLRCDKHYVLSNEGDNIDGPAPKRKNCAVCQENATFEPKVDNNCV